MKIPEQVMRWDGTGRELCGLRTPRLGHEKGGRSSQVPTQAWVSAPSQT